MIEDCLFVGGPFDGCWMARNAESESHLAGDSSGPLLERTETLYLRDKRSYNGVQVTVYAAEYLQPDKVHEKVFEYLAWEGYVLEHLEITWRPDGVGFPIRENLERASWRSYRDALEARNKIAPDLRRKIVITPEAPTGRLHP